MYALQIGVRNKALNESVQVQEAVTATAALTKYWQWARTLNLRET